MVGGHIFLPLCTLPMAVIHDCLNLSCLTNKRLLMCSLESHHNESQSRLVLESKWSGLIW